MTSTYIGVVVIGALVTAGFVGYYLSQGKHKEAAEELFCGIGATVAMLVGVKVLHWITAL